MPVTSPNDVGSRIGRTLTTEELPLVTTLIGDAENMIRVRLPGRVMDDTTVDMDLVPQVVANAVVRVLRNPDGYRSENAGGVGYTVDTRVAAGFLTILSDEWSLLGLSAQGANAGMGSFAPLLGTAYGTEPTLGYSPWL